MNKVALITGGSRGIGLGIAEQLAKDGFDLAINGVRPEEQVKNVLDDLRKYRSRIIYCQGDVSSTEDRKKIMQKLKKEIGRLNVLVNNAGIAPKQRNDIMEATEESFEYVLRVNLQGPYFLTQQVANWMVEQKQKDENYWGAIINITSISATVASVNRGEYCISKAGLGMVTQLFAARLGEFDLPVYEVRPGVIATDMTAGVKEKYDKLFAEGLTVQKRWGLPEDIGKVVASLARGDMPYSTGSVIMVDGGLTLQRL